MILIQRKVDVQREAQKRQKRASDVRTVITAFKRGGRGHRKSVGRNTGLFFFFSKFNETSLFTVPGSEVTPGSRINTHACT